MDISTNAIDLMYLTNSRSFNSATQNQKTVLYTKEDLKKYRTRIFEQTRDILIGKSIDKETKAAFDEYVKLSINNFKFADKRDIIQQDYANIKISKKKFSKFDYKETNKLVFKSEKPSHIRITDCIPVKRKTKTKKKLIIPQQRDFSNHNAVAKSKEVTKPKEKPQKKVVEKDNIIIRYDEKKIKEKNKKKQKK